MRMVWLMLLFLWTLFTSSQPSQPCSFNSMCSCRYINSSGTIRDVSCVGVPFYKLPDLPHIDISHLDVVGAGLETVDDSLAGQIETLRLITNSIITISDKTFTSMANSLRSLDLSQNRLEEVPAQAICYLKSLNWLNLHGNQIPTLEGNDWCHLKDTLDSLFLGENELQELPRETLRTLRSLTWLSLDHNLLRKVEPLSLPESLQTLSVQHNYLEQVPNIDRIKSLVRLSLRGNLIKSVPDYSLQNRKRLEKLDLGNNFINNIDNMFNKTINVRDLSLDLNKIRSLNDKNFLGTNAGRIILALNRIENISTNAFVGLEDSLEYIDLERNLLTSFPDALSMLRKLKYLYIPSNKISLY
ncbi:chaoptin-like [Homalodisca vitripennis]|uniref:chaoptin-like n=1 Tax=Homalodisca vitripennis TaxID=197043 RepID=UPI001EEB45AB|nr:chaoptin-like [Homalodisca vitripennis]